MMTTAAMAISAGAMPIVAKVRGVCFGLGELTDAHRVGLGEQGLTDPRAGLGGEIDRRGELAEGDDVGGGAELVEGVPQLAPAGLGRPQGGVELFELRPGPRPGGDHQGILDTGAAGQRDPDDVDVHGERVLDDARRACTVRGSARRRPGRTSRPRRTAPPRAVR